MRMAKYALACLIVITTSARAQMDTIVIAPDDPIVAMIDSLMLKEHIRRDAYTFKADGERYRLPESEVPETPDSIFKARLEALNATTPFEFEFNDDVLAYLKLYTDKRRSFTAICMGRSAMYFPLFEEKLAKYDMPLELRCLSVVESALNPTAKSYAGAMGLWQFMPSTGKMYGLDMDSYVDERRDPIKSTEAACQLLRSLYSYYGDWSMALAAYNAGPGTVNRAIRRSGGKMTYWEIRPFLPKETQGYVPAFIAVNYAMHYTAEHNIVPRKPEKHFYEVDTVHIKDALHFHHLAVVTELPSDLLKELNPLYKTDHIPNLDKQQYLYLPVSAIGKFIANEDSLYSWCKKPRTDSAYIAYTGTISHVVQEGEFLAAIANKHKCSVDELMVWNKMSDKTVVPGQKLYIRTTVHKPVEQQYLTGTTKPTQSYTNNASQSASGTTTNQASGSYYYYTIQQGDTLWDIAQKKGISLSRLQQLNQGLNPRDLKVGSRIKVGVKNS